MEISFSALYDAATAMLLRCYAADASATVKVVVVVLVVAAAAVATATAS